MPILGGTEIFQVPELKRKQCGLVFERLAEVEVSLHQVVDRRADDAFQAVGLCAQPFTAAFGRIGCRENDIESGRKRAPVLIAH